MKCIKIITVVCTFFLIAPTFCQTKKIELLIYPSFGQTVLHLADSVFLTEKFNFLQIESLKFYISNIQLLKDAKIVFEEKNSFHLIDAADENTWRISMQSDLQISFDELKFGLGIDSLTNVSGVLGGDLDPTKGMYWTWQSGYINFKLEGKSQSCKTKNSEFIFHLGGYKQPFGAYQTLSIPVNNINKIYLSLDLELLFRGIDLTKTNHLMSPGLEAVQLSKILATCFKISTH